MPRLSGPALRRALVHAVRVRPMTAPEVALSLRDAIDGETRHHLRAVRLAAAQACALGEIVHDEGSRDHERLLRITDAGRELLAERGAE